MRIYTRKDAKQAHVHMPLISSLGKALDRQALYHTSGVKSRKLLRSTQLLDRKDRALEAMGLLK